MVVPDYELIAEIMLVAEGFINARILARKFLTLYTLCKELLSKQDHYDWGLRAIKSVLVVAGSLKRGDRGRPEDQVKDSIINSLHISIIKSTLLVCINNIKMFLREVAPAFSDCDACNGCYLTIVSYKHTQELRSICTSIMATIYKSLTGKRLALFETLDTFAQI